MRRFEKLILLTEALRKVRDDFKPKQWRNPNYHEILNPNAPQYLTEKGYERPFITRYDLRRLIRGTLNIVDAHTVNGWIEQLLEKGILQQNPHTHITKSGKIKPSNDTRYFITVTHLKRDKLLSQTQTTLLTF